MNPVILLDWARKNSSLSLLLASAICLAFALGQIVRGATFSLLIPVALVGAACGWEAGKFNMGGKQVTGWLGTLGIVVVSVFVTGLVVPIGRLLLSIFTIGPQVFLWLYDRTPVDFSFLIAAWFDLILHSATVFSRLGAWFGTLATGNTVIDPLVTGLAWSILLWLVGIWSGWRLQRKHLALQALAPGSLVFALSLDYTGRGIGLLVVYLAILLTLIGLSHYERLRLHWQQRGIDFSESIAFDFVLVTVPLIVGLVGLAAITPSLSWRDMVERIHAANQNGSNRVAQSLGLEPPPNVATNPAYRSDGLPLQHLLGLTPDQRQELVFTVSTGELPPLPYASTTVSANRYYWRTVTYDDYTGTGWASSAAQEISLPANTSLMKPPPNARELHEQIHIFSDQNKRLIWTGTLAQLDTSADIAWRTLPPSNPTPAHDGDMLGAITGTNQYNVLAYLPQINAEQLRQAGNDYPAEIANRYLGLPESVPERVLAQARELTKTAATPYDRAVAIETYLRQFPYTLEVAPPPSGRDVVDYFLFTAQKGYCDYYASAMVVLARAAGLPARIVIGYASGTYNMATAQYEIRQEDAHSWPEIYFPGIGWVEFEPTANQPEITHPASTNASQSDLNPAPVEVATSWLKEKWQILVSTIAGQISLTIATLMLLIVLWQAGEIWLLHLQPQKIVIQSLYTRLETGAARLLPDLSRGHTPHELQSLLVKKLRSSQNRMLRSKQVSVEEEIEQIVKTYEAQIFSPRQSTRKQAQASIKAWARLRWKLLMAGWEKQH